MICSICGNLIHPEQMTHEEHLNGYHNICPPMMISTPHFTTAQAKKIARRIWDKYINSDQVRGIEDLEYDIMNILENKHNT